MDKANSLGHVLAAWRILVKSGRGSGVFTSQCKVQYNFVIVEGLGIPVLIFDSYR